MTAPQPELRDGKEAIALAIRAVSLSDSRDPVLIGTLAAAYAEAGFFHNAAATAEDAFALAFVTGQKEVAEANNRLASLYISGKTVASTGNH